MSILKTIYLQHLNGGSPNATLDANGNMTVTGTVAGASSNMFRNRIINGDMRIDQRNAGASVVTSPSGYVLVDRFKYNTSTLGKFTAQQNKGSVTPPTGFTNYLGFTTTTAYSITSSDANVLRQAIEGYNTADLAWGTANAKTVTLSFWVYSSLTGTFGGSIENNDENRAMPFSYTINSANTWEYKTITIPGDTTGTWYKDNSTGIQVIWSLGSGSNVQGIAGTWYASQKLSAVGETSLVGTLNANWYITGVQLEAGTKATPFEFRSYGQELALCQRYYEIGGDSGGGVQWSGNSTSGAAYYATIPFKVTKRAVPTVTPTSINNYGFSSAASTVYINAGVLTECRFTRTSNSSVNGAYFGDTWTASAEL